MKVDYRNLVTNLAGIVGVTGVSLLIAVPTGANEVLNTNPSIFNEATYNRSQRIPADTQYTPDALAAPKATNTKTPSKNTQTIVAQNTGGQLNPRPSILQECPYNRAACPGRSTSPEGTTTTPEPGVGSPSIEPGAGTPPTRPGTGTPVTIPAPGAPSTVPDRDAPPESPAAPKPGTDSPSTTPGTGKPSTGPSPGAPSTVPDRDAPPESPAAPKPGTDSPSTTPGTGSPSTAPGSGTPSTAPSSGSTDSKNIVALAEANGSFTVLTKALRAAGLAETLQGAGPFTVFAPTDAAFAKLPQDAVQDLLKPENKEVLVKILRYHVVQGSLLSNNLKSGQVKSIEGGQISVKVDQKTGVTVNDAKVVQADIKASNGVIHVIDNVILPPDL